MKMASLDEEWQVFDLEQEYRKILHSTNDWRISFANKDFSLCPTYPRIVLVPKSIDDVSLIQVAKFRCLGRFPLLSYYHKTNRACIVRSGQPMVGPTNKRCSEDEKFLNAIIGNNRGYIIETRTQNISQLAKTKGGGHEPEAHYPLLKRVHRPIDRYNTLFDSLQKLVEACQDKSNSLDRWFNKLESTNWFRHLHDILECACLIAQCINDGTSVLVHGSEGMDSTLQVCSLAQIILDPDCRTVLGFEALIEREWLQAGHPFATRCKYSPYASNNLGSAERREHSPIFLLFLDCVFQLFYQYSASFEFNEDFLVFLLDNAYGSQFGTFLGNNPKERELSVSTKTASLWSYINRPDVLDKFLNPFYEPQNEIIWPSIAPQSFELWESVYFRGAIDFSSKERCDQMLDQIKQQKKLLGIEIERRRKRLLELQQATV